VAGKVIDSLWVRLGFSVDHQKLAAFKSQVDGIKHAVQGMAALIGIQAVRQVAAFVEHAVGGAADVQKFAEATGMAASEVDAMSRAVADADVGAEEMRGTIESVYRATGMAAAGFPRFAKLFKILGIEAKDSSGKAKSAAVVMAELAGKFSKMDPATRIAMAARLGISARLSAFMAEQGNAGLGSRFEEARGSGLLSDDDFEKADKTEKAFERLHRTIRGITTVIALELSPWVTKITDGFLAWWKANRKEVVTKVREGFTLLGAALKRVWGWGTELIGVFRGLYKWLDKLGIATWVFYGAAAALALVKLGAWALGIQAAVSKLNGALLVTSLHMLKIGLAVAVAYLALQDLATFFRGGDSLIGRFVEFTDGLEGARTALLGIALIAAVLLGPLSIALVGILAWSIAIKDLVDNLNVVKNWFLDGWTSITKAVDDAWSKVKDFAAWILDSPAGKALRWALVNVLGANDAGTSAWVDSQNQDHNDRASQQQNYDANHPANSANMAPSYFEGGQGVWRMRGGTNVRNDNAVTLNIAKIVSERPEDVPRIMAGQVNPMLRDAQSPVRL
jgi:hypothetical protein